MTVVYVVRVVVSGGGGCWEVVVMAGGVVVMTGGTEDAVVLSMVWGVLEVSGMCEVEGIKVVVPWGYDVVVLLVHRA